MTRLEFPGRFKKILRHMDTLTYFLDWRQIVNSLIGSAIAVLIFAPSTYFVIRWAARLAHRYRFGLAVVVTLSGVLLFGSLVGPSLYEEYQDEKYVLSILSQARSLGGDEPQPQVAFSCVDICDTEIRSAAGICLNSNVQFRSEVVGEYGSRNRAGLRTFIACMQSFGYLARHCQSDLSNCVSVPDTGYRNPGSTVHYSAECTSTESNAIVCEYEGRYE